MQTNMPAFRTEYSTLFCLLYCAFLDISPPQLIYRGKQRVVGMKTEREHLNVMKGVREYSWFKPAFLAAQNIDDEKEDRPAYEPRRDVEEWGT